LLSPIVGLNQKYIKKCLLSQNLRLIKSEQGGVSPQFTMHVDEVISLTSSDLALLSGNSLHFWFISDLAEHYWHERNTVNIVKLRHITSLVTQSISKFNRSFGLSDNEMDEQ